MWCNVCKGLIKPRCFICGQTPKEMKEEYLQLVEHYEYLKLTWVKLRKFNMKGTGDVVLDLEIVKAFGHWIPKPKATEPTMAERLTSGMRKM